MQRGGVHSCREAEPKMALRQESKKCETFRVGAWLAAVLPPLVVSRARLHLDSTRSPRSTREDRVLRKDLYFIPSNDILTDQ